MEFQFVLILQENPNLGWVLAPFELIKEEGQAFYQMSEYITPTTNKKYLQPHEVQIVEVLSHCLTP